MAADLEKKRRAKSPRACERIQTFGYFMVRLKEIMRSLSEIAQWLAFLMRVNDERNVQNWATWSSLFQPVSYQLSHTGSAQDEGMQSLLALYILVDKYAARIPDLNLEGDEQEEYSTILLWLQNQVEAGRRTQPLLTTALLGYSALS
jgi:hypothetical protein